MSSHIVQFETSAVKNAAAVMDLRGVDRVFDMMDGESFKDRFPSTAAFHFNPDFKRNTLLVDCLINVASMMVCSERLKSFIEAKTPDKIEYLPVTVYDLKGKPVEPAYFVIHPIDPLDCIDFAKSDVTWSELDTTSIMYADHVEIDDTKVPANRLIFRPKSFPDLILLRRDFALEIEKAGFTGAGWREID